MSSTPNDTIFVQLPDGTNTQSSHEAVLNLHPALPPTAQEAHTLPSLHNSLLSIGQLCDSGCTATFDKTTATITYQSDNIIIWHVDLPTSNPTVPLYINNSYINNAFRPNSTIKERIEYFHSCCFSPSLSTWCKAIDAGHFATWPSLTSQLVRQYPPRSIAMYKGHLDQTRKNQHSTKITTTNIANNMTLVHPDTLKTDTLATTAVPEQGIRCHHIFTACEPITGKIASDLTGRFVLPSSTGKMLHTGSIRLRQQHDLCRAHENPLRHRPF